MGISVSTKGFAGKEFEEYVSEMIFIFFYLMIKLKLINFRNKTPTLYLIILAKNRKKFILIKNKWVMEFVVKMKK